MAKKRARRLRETSPAYGDPTEVVSASEFKARCLELIEKIQRTRGEVLVTRYGKPVARLLPAEPAAVSAFGYLRGRAIETGDIVAPTGERWNADA